MLEKRNVPWKSFDSNSVLTDYVLADHRNQELRLNPLKQEMQTQ